MQVAAKVRILLDNWLQFVAGAVLLSLAVYGSGQPVLGADLVILAGLAGALAGVGVHAPHRPRNPCWTLRRVFGMPRSALIVATAIGAMWLALGFFLRGLVVPEAVPMQRPGLIAAANAWFCFGAFYGFTGLFCVSRARARLRKANFMQKHAWREAAEVTGPLDMAPGAPQPAPAGTGDGAEGLSLMPGRRPA